MRDHLQAGEQFVTTRQIAEIYWLDGDTEKAVAMLQPFRPGRTSSLRWCRLGRGYRGRRRDPDAGDQLSPGIPRPLRPFGILPAKAAAPAAPLLIGNPSFAYMHVGRAGARAGILRDEVSGDYFQPISPPGSASDLRRGAKTERFKSRAISAWSNIGARAAGWRSAAPPAPTISPAIDPGMRDRGRMG
jgi:hypothetical protein